jgi:DNA-binding transcriptional regulator YhcF (GntR family)
MVSNPFRRLSTNPSVKKQKQEASPGAISTKNILSLNMVLSSAPKNTKARNLRPQGARQFQNCHIASCGRIRPGLSFASGWFPMDIRIDRKSEIPIRQQLAEHIVYAIATEKLKPGQALPSVRELARRLKIHHNTVSQAYKDLVGRTWLVGRRGSRVIVRLPGKKENWANGSDLDDFINATIRVARQQGYSLQTLRERVRTRLLAEPPDHILVVEEEPGLRLLLQEEIRAALAQPAEGCCQADLVAHPGLAIGALTVAGHYAIGEVDSLVPKSIPAISLAFSAADEHLDFLRKLAQPSVIAVVSVSEAFLQTARALLAPALGRRHVMRDFCFPLEDPKAVQAADLVFADTIARSQVKHRKIFQYRLIAPASLEYLCTAMKSYQRR